MTKQNGRPASPALPTLTIPERELILRAHGECMAVMESARARFQGKIQALLELRGLDPSQWDVVMENGTAKLRPTTSEAPGGVPPALAEGIAKRVKAGDMSPEAAAQALREAQA